ncbi:MAG: FecR domain-containing protein [Acidobacteriaceae bacterium]
MKRALRNGWGRASNVQGGGGSAMRVRDGVLGWCGVASLVVCLAAGAPAAAGQHGANTFSSVRAVRLTFLEGSVSVDTSDDAGSQPAQRNMPLVEGTHLSTGDNGEAEVEFEDGSVVRLTPNSSLSLDSMSIDRDGVFATRMSLLRGLAYAELRATPEYRYKIAAGTDSLVPVDNATVRVDFDEVPAVFAVLDGTAEVSREDSIRREVRSGESLRFDSGGAGQYRLSQGVSDQTWDGWNNDRDRAESGQVKAATGVRGEYAGAQGYGWSDLDANGTWYDVPGQGQVWQPSAAAVDASFDPYGNGSWVYVGPGYVWASGYGWGWTPYRCGTWNYFNGFGWGWAPVGCGGTGWRFVDSGRPVNVVLCPGGYTVPHVPHPHPGPVQPVLPVNEVAPVAFAGQMGWGSVLQRGPRQGGGTREINGVVATPVVRDGAASLRAGSVTETAKSGRSALDRDFPVNSQNRTAIMGRVSAQPGVVRTDAGWRRDPEVPRPVPGGEDYTGQSGAPMYRRVPGSAPDGQRPMYSAPQRDRPGGASGQMPHPVYLPAPQAAPSAQQMPRPYSPAPQPQVRPYTPAPALAPAQRSAPPPAPTSTSRRAGPSAN